MGYELMARMHVALAGMRSVAESRASERGQGTVEYVGLILLLAVVLAGVVKTANGFSDDKGIATTIVGKLKQAIADVGGGGKS
jgi:hypothetical protein